MAKRKKANIDTDNNLQNEALEEKINDELLAENEQPDVTITVQKLSAVRDYFAEKVAKLESKLKRGEVVMAEIDSDGNKFNPTIVSEVGFNNYWSKKQKYTIIKKK